MLSAEDLVLSRFNERGEFVVGHKFNAGYTGIFDMEISGTGVPHMVGMNPDPD
jgi:hypothetical protein